MRFVGRLVGTSAGLAQPVEFAWATLMWSCQLGAISKACNIVTCSNLLIRPKSVGIKLYNYGDLWMASTHFHGFEAVSDGLAPRPFLSMSRWPPFEGPVTPKPVRNCNVSLQHEKKHETHHLALEQGFL